jgi:hypothetical protein
MVTHFQFFHVNCGVTQSIASSPYIPVDFSSYFDTDICRNDDRIAIVNSRMEIQSVWF